MTSPRTARIEHHDWTRDPRTIALLAKVRADEPKRVRKSIVYTLTREEWFEYEGPVVDRLAAIQREHGQSILNACHEAEDYSAFTAHVALGTVHDLIDAALSQPSKRIAA